MRFGIRYTRLELWWAIRGPQVRARHSRHWGCNRD